MLLGDVSNVDDPALESGDVDVGEPRLDVLEREEVTDVNDVTDS